MRFAIATMTSLLVLSNATAGVSRSTEENRDFSEKLVHQLLRVKQGDIVLIYANPTQMALTEEIATSVRAVGAHTVVTMRSNRMGRLYFERVPARFDTQPPKAELKLAAMADETIFIEAPFDPSVTKGVPAGRLAALTNAGAPVTAYFLKHSIPGMSIGNGILPSAGTAAQYGVSSALLSSVFYSGLNADYSQLHRDATAVASMVSAGHRMHVTSPNGTNLTLTVTGAPVELNDGIVSAADRARSGAAVQKQLPAGDVYFLPKPNSVSGTVVFGDSRVQGTLVSRLTVRFVDGKIRSMSAKSGMDAVKKLYAVGGAGRDELAFIDFGANRSMHVDATAQWGGGPSMAAGYVTVGLGNNQGFGGPDRSPFAFLSNVPNATVLVDGKPVITGGKLASAL